MQGEDDVERGLDGLVQVSCVDPFGPRSGAHINTGGGMVIKYEMAYWGKQTSTPTPLGMKMKDVCGGCGVNVYKFGTPSQWCWCDPQYDVIVTRCVVWG